MTPSELANLRELLSDAENTTRLSGWETSFVDDLRDSLLIHGERMTLSEKQWAIVRRIENKLYAT